MKPEATPRCYSSGHHVTSTAVGRPPGGPFIAMHSAIMCGELVALRIATPIIYDNAFGSLGDRGSFSQLPFGIAFTDGVTTMMANLQCRMVDFLLRLEREVNYIIIATDGISNILAGVTVRARWFAATVEFSKIG